MSDDPVTVFLSSDYNVYRLMQENEDMTIAAIRAMPIQHMDDRARIRQLETELVRALAENAALRRQINRKEDSVLDEVYTIVKEIRKGQQDAKAASACASVAEIREKYKTAKPTNLSDLVGLLNEYVDNEDQYRKDELDE